MEQGKRKNLIKWVSLIVVVVFISLIPTDQQFTPIIKQFFIISISCIGMFALNLFPSPLIPSLILIFALSSVSDLNTIMSGWANDAPWCVICVLIILTVMHRTPLLKRISYNCMILTGATYVGACVSIYLVGLCCSFLGDSVCCALIGLAFGIATAFMQASNGIIPEGENKRAAAGIMLCSYFGVTDAGMFILNPSAVPFFYSLASTVNDSIPSYISYVDWFRYNIIYVPYYIILLVSIILAFRPKHAQKVNMKSIFRNELEQLGPMSIGEKKLLIIVALLFVYLITSSFHHLRMTYGFVAAVVLLFAPGIELGNSSDIRSVNFSFPLFIAACLGMGAVANSLGIGDLLVNLLMPYLNTGNPFLFFLTIAVIVFFLNFVLTPTAIYSCLLIPLATISTGLPFVNDILPLIMSMLVGVQAVLMPHETANTMILYSFDVLTMKDFVQGFGIKIILSLIWLAFAVAFWSFVGLIS